MNTDKERKKKSPAKHVSARPGVFIDLGTGLELRQCLEGSGEIATQPANLPTRARLQVRGLRPSNLRAVDRLGNLDLGPEEWAIGCHSDCCPGKLLAEFDDCGSCGRQGVGLDVEADELDGDITALTWRILARLD